MISGIEIRRARKEDVPDIARIYNYAILNTTATFDMDPKTLEDRMEWFNLHSDDYPLLVITVDGKVAAWAEIRPFGKRKAYRYTVENAVYVDCDYQEKGLGTQLLNELSNIARKKGYHAIIALIVGGNNASIKLHEKVGFKHVGTMQEVGCKFDQWLDVIVYEKILNN